MSLYPDEIKNPDEMEYYCLILIDLIENRDKRLYFVQLEGILKMHV